MEECHTYPHTPYFNSTVPTVFRRWSDFARLRRRTYDFAVNLGIHLTDWQRVMSPDGTIHSTKTNSSEANKLESQKGIMPPDHQMCMNPMRIL